LKRRGAPVVAAAALLLGAATGCQTVDLGAPPADVNLCEPSQQYFVTQIWPNFLGNTYNSKHCFDSSCHGTGTLTAMTLTDITASIATLSTPPPNPLPPDILADYAQATQKMNCADPLDSDLLIYPENRLAHGGGMLIAPTGPEPTLVQMWITAP
jgi:hypothetical protein